MLKVTQLLNGIVRARTASVLVGPMFVQHFTAEAPSARHTQVPKVRNRDIVMRAETNCHKSFLHKKHSVAKGVKRIYVELAKKFVWILPHDVREKPE